MTSQEAGNQEFITRVVGVTFEGRQEILEHIHASSPLLLVRETSNSHDRNAIAVFWTDQKIGYLNRKLAAQIAPGLDQAKITTVPATVVQILGSDPLGVEVKFYLPTGLLKKPRSVWGAAVLGGLGCAWLANLGLTSIGILSYFETGGTLNNLAIHFLFNFVSWTLIFAVGISLKRRIGAPLLIALLVFVGGAVYFVAQAANPDPTAVSESSNKTQDIQSNNTLDENLAASTPAGSVQKPTPTKIHKIATNPPVSSGIIPVPAFGTLAASGTHESSIGEWQKFADHHARNLAIGAPYQWEFYELDSNTRYADAEQFFRNQLKPRGYSQTFNDQGQGEIYLLKYKHDDEIITIQFWGASGGDPPAMLVYYHAW